MKKQAPYIIKKLGRRILKLRQERGWSQMTLAAEAKLDKSYIGYVERGTINASIKNIAMIADALGVSLQELF